MRLLGFNLCRFRADADRQMHAFWTMSDPEGTALRGSLHERYAVQYTIASNITQDILVEVPASPYGT